MSTILFLLIARCWSALSRTVGSAPYFADSIMYEAAQRFRDELDRLSTSQSIYLGGILVFAMLFAAAYVLQAQLLFAGYPDWQLYLQLAFLLLVAGFALYRLTLTFLARRAVRFLRDANIAIGHQLQQVSNGIARVFHDVKTSAGMVDHVVVGQTGMYAIHVVAKRAGSANHVRLDENSLHFSNSAESQSLIDIAARTSRLEKEFQQILGHPVRVRSVIAIPGWEIDEQANPKHLLVNERNISMLRGWKDNSDHLMNEEVELLSEAMTAKCLRSTSTK
ncbi:MAG: hypothetical protein GY949_11700 [Gammaproteobacteria bacterium]|nr:hypothetical protein [Gammaproteobacteria bacterium]